MSFQVETNNPRSSSETAQTCGVGGETGQPHSQLADHTGVIIKHAVGTLFFAYLVPDVFLWVELSSIRRQAQQANILWDHQVLRHIRAGAINNHQHKLRGMGRTDLRQAPMATEIPPPVATSNSPTLSGV